MELSVLREAAASCRNQIIEDRNRIHQNPELGFHEKETSAFVRSRLEQMGVPYTLCRDGYGLTAVIDSGVPGKSIGFRADMDALPIQEENDVPYCSRIPGVMHACGHDGHTAVLLGLAEVLSEHPEFVESGKVKLFFQPAEEVPPGGAKTMVEEGAADDVDEVFALHFQGGTPVGTVHTTPGAIMATADNFRIVIRGKSAHAADPNLASDALLAGAASVCSLQHIVSRFINPLDAAVLSVCSFNSGGNVSNILQDEARLLGTVRVFDAETADLVEEKMREVLSGVCRMYGTGYELEIEKGYPAVINDPTVSERTMAALEQAGFNVEKCRPDMGGEDFAYFLNHRPGCFVYFGCSDFEKGITDQVHTPLFDIAEEALEQALFCELVIYEDAVGRL